MDAEDGADEKAITAMGLLSTIETLINCMEENPKIMEQIEPITLQVVGLILTKNVMGKQVFSTSYIIVVVKLTWIFLSLPCLFLPSPLIS